MIEEDLIGKRIGNYHLVKEIDRGSFGVVYRAQHSIFKDEPLVALKLIYNVFRSDEEHKRFIQEAQILKKLRHPYILRNRGRAT